MTTYIAATPSPSDATVRLRVEAREPGYEDAVNVDTYELDAAGAAAELALWEVPAGVAATSDTGGFGLRFTADPGGTYTVARPVTGLDVGQTYRLLVGGDFTSTGGGALKDMSTLTFGIEGQDPKPYFENLAGRSSTGGYADADPSRTVLVFEWTATATEQSLQFHVDTTGGQYALLSVYAFVVQATPAERAVFETYAQPADDDLWTLYGSLPGDIGRGVAIETDGPPGARAIGFELQNFGTGDVPTPEETFGQRVTLSGLVPGLTYTARVVVSTKRLPYDVNPPWVRLVLDGTGESSEPSWAGWQRIRFVATASTHVLRAQIVNALSLRPGDVVGLFVHYARVDLVDELTDARRVVGLTRSDGNGARDVRAVAGTRMQDGTYLVTDHEAALTGLVTYTVATQRIDVPDPATTTEVATVQTFLDLAGNRFTQVITPRLAEPARMVETYDASQTSSGTVQDVIDRADPIVTKGVLRRRRGRMTVWHATYEDAERFTHLFDNGDDVLWRQSRYRGLDMYFTAENVRTRAYDAPTKVRRWAVELDYVEVAFPTAPIAGDAAWNFRAGALRNATFWDDLREFPTFADRLNGPAQVA